MVYDKTLRELFSEVPTSLIKLLTNQNITKLLETSFPKVEREADLIVELENNEIFHLEIQSINDNFMPYRMLEYGLLINRAYKKFPRQMVLYVGVEKNRIKNSINLEKLSFSYDVIDIRDIDCNILINSDKIQDNVLAILCNIQNPTQFFDKIMKKLLNLNNKQREEYMRKLIILARLRPNIYKQIENNLKEYKVPFILDKKYDPLYKDGWNEAWSEAWSEAQTQAKIDDAISIIQKFHLPIEEVAKTLQIDKNIIIKNLKDKNERQNISN